MIGRALYLADQFAHSWPKRDKDASARLVPAVETIERQIGRLLWPARVLSVGPRNLIEVELLEAAGWGEVDAVDLFPTSPRIRRGDMHRLPCPSNDYGLVFASHVLEHARDLHQATREIARVLRPEGWLWIATPRGAPPNRHDRQSFAGPEDVVEAFRHAAPEVVHDGSNEREIRLLLRLRKQGARLRVLVVLTDEAAVRHWAQAEVSPLLGARGHRVWAWALLGPGGIAGPRWRCWLRRGILRTLSYAAREVHEPTYRTKLDLRRPWRQRLEVHLARALSAWVDTERLARGLERLLPVARAARKMLAAERPDVLVVHGATYHGLDAEVMKAARRAGVPILHAPLSWDTLTSKGCCLVRPDALAVWGEASRAHAVERHGVAPARVFVTGPVHWDHYAGSVPEVRMAAPAILVAGTSIAYWSEETEVVSAIARALPLQTILYRLHPRRRPDAGLRDLLPPNVSVDSTAGGPGGARMLHWALAHCQVVVTAFSTVVIEAALLGKPTLLVGFGASTGGTEFEGRPAEGRLVDVAAFAHMAEVTTWPGVVLCRSEKELLEELRWLLGPAPAGEAEVRSIRAVLRRRRAERVARCLDGKARERLCAAVEEVAQWRAR